MMDCEQDKAQRKLESLSKEVGALIMAAGITTGMLPPPPGPFDMMIILTGGLVLWPRGFRTVEGWARKRYPRAHAFNIALLERFLADLDRRYPNWTGRAPASGAVTGQSCVEKDDRTGRH